MRLLVVEDEQMLAAQLAQALTESDYAVDVVHNGVDALHAGETGDYDAVVLDLGLPQMDGITVLT
jgi:two-component system OmpR family response regulator